jgi:pimeloyl-ACP methyl ester carboxylesterase
MSTTDGTAAEARAGTALTAENRSVEIEEATLVYRRFGDSESDPPPLLCLQHFRGNLDNWDPALVDRLATDREVVLLDNRGVGGSTGVVPDNVDDMARDALRFVDALGLREIDLLGFSLGGCVAQEVALVRPRLVRRLVLAGTAPRGAPRIHRWSDDVYALAARDELDPNRFISLSSPALRRAGPRPCSSSSGSPPGPPAVTNRPTWPAATPNPSKLARLAAITQPTFVANGDNDLMLITENSRLLAEHLPNSQLRIYPDSGHGFLDQHPEQFADHVRAFLNGR